jgi:3-deoxy-D-manno-octulosonic-acid transferase
MGFLPLDFELKRPIWLHAVSVGEVMAARSLIESLRRRYPLKKIALSTVTPTGNRVAKSLIQQGDLLFYLPLDLSFIVKKVVDKINPALFIVVETEIWPNLISYLYKKGVPVVLVNGRISDRSFVGYRIVKFLLRPTLEKINLFCVQTEMDFKRLLHLGVERNKIKITGNMKFDFIDYTDLKIDYTDYKLRLGLGSQEKLLVCGSTHPGEEDIILNVYKRLLETFVSLKLLIAPRHPERAKEIEKIVIKYGFCPNRISQLNEQTEKRTNGPTVFILDSIGELLSFYRIADIVFVGGSLVKKGGHNILEPAYFEKPIIFGSYMFNFRDIGAIFLKNNAALLVQNSDALYKNITILLNDPLKAAELGKRARAIIFNNQGAAKRNLEWIGSIFSGT